MLKLNFKPFPILQTERLVLRQLKMTDAPEVFALRSDDRVLQYIDRPKAKTMKDARNYIAFMKDGMHRKKWIIWAITLKGAEKLIGSIVFWNISIKEDSAEIGYELHPDFQGQGIMQEAFTKVMEFGFINYKFRRIEAYSTADNSRSIKLLERNGFIKEANSEKEGLVVFSCKLVGNQ